MCLEIISGPHRANKDLYTLKFGVVEEKSFFYTPYQYYRMEYGQVYKARLQRETCVYTDQPLNRIGHGLHSLQASQLRIRKEWLSRRFDGGLSNNAVILCRIPKGSTYYKGNRADIASSRLQPLYPLLFNDRVAEDYKLWRTAKGSYEKYLTYLDADFSWLDEIQEVCNSYNIELL